MELSQCEESLQYHPIYYTEKFPKIIKWKKPKPSLILLAIFLGVYHSYWSWLLCYSGSTGCYCRNRSTTAGIKDLVAFCIWLLKSSRDYKSSFFELLINRLSILTNQKSKNQIKLYTHSATYLVGLQFVQGSDSELW